MVQELSDAIQQAELHYQRLVLLVGEHSSEKTTLLRHVAENNGYPYLRLSLEISERMLSIPASQRTVEADGLVKQLVSDADVEVVLLDNIELLFCPALQIDPLKVLQGASRNTVVVAAWPGSFQDSILTYAAPGHPEHRSYRAPDAIIVPINP